MLDSEIRETQSALAVNSLSTSDQTCFYFGRFPITNLFWINLRFPVWQKEETTLRHKMNFNKGHRQFDHFRAEL